QERRSKAAEGRPGVSASRTETAGCGPQLRRKPAGRERKRGGVRSGDHQQVEQDEASEHERNVSRGCGRTRYASSDRQQQHAESHARETDRLHANAPEPRDRPDSKKKTEEQEHIDRSASPGICAVTGDAAASLTGET